MYRMKTTVAAFALLFGAASIAGAAEYDLAAYLSRAERENVDLKLARRDLDSASLSVAQARSALLPTVAAQGGYTRNLLDIEQSTAVAADLSGSGTVAPLVYQKIDTNYDNEFVLALAVNQKLFDPAAIASYAKAKKGKEISAKVYETTRRSVLSAAKKLYAQTLLTGQVLEVMATAERTAEDTYRSAERRFKAGLSSELDLLMAESSWKTSIPTTAEARRNAEIVLLAFKNLAGIPLSEPVSLTEKNESIPPLPEQVELAKVLASRPDFSAVRMSKEIADVARKAALASFLPTVSGSFTYAKGLYRGYASPSDSYDFDSAQVDISVTIPLFTGGYRLALTEAAKNEQEKAALSIEKKSADIERELLSIRLSLEEAFKRIDSARAAANVASRAFELSRSSYANGLGTQLNVDDASSKLAQARLGLYNAIYTYRAACYDWELAVGGTD